MVFAGTGNTWMLRMDSRINCVVIFCFVCITLLFTYTCNTWMLRMDSRINCVVIFCFVCITLLFTYTYKYGSLYTERTFSGNIQPIVNQRDRGPTQVLLLTYMRSGSSLVGDILQHMPDAFYVYEPLRMLGVINKRNASITYVNGTTRMPPYDIEEESIRFLFNWFTCNISSLPEAALRDSQFLGQGLKTKTFIQCLKVKQSQRRDAKTCLTSLQTMCTESPMRIIKVIRMPLGAVQWLLDALPNLKIVHLIRDPRATLRSQQHLSMCTDKKGGRAGCINKYCTRLENDVLEEENTNINYPGRYKTAFYENIARSPIEASKELYNFCGGAFTDSARKYIYNITLAGNPNNCAICTVRSNSTEHIDSWKTKMPIAFIDMVQERCNFVLKRYNYEIYDTSEYI